MEESSTIIIKRINKLINKQKNKSKKLLACLKKKSIIIIIGLLIVLFFTFKYFLLSAKKSIREVKRYISINNDAGSSSKLDIEELYKLRNDFTKQTIYLDNIIKLKNNNLSNERYLMNSESNKEFNQKMMEKYKYEQYYFCENIYSFYKKEFEKKIRLVDVNFNDQKYNMFVYDKDDIVSNSIIRSKTWESRETNRLLNALKFYSNKTNIQNKDIYFVDIGGNIGWYSILLGRYGYNIISFEPSEINNYILKKNFCLNKGINITIINKGLFTEEKKCDLHNQIKNEGNGMIICENERNKKKNFLFKQKTGEIILTKFSNYIPFLTKNNLALIKIDIEGSEGKAIEGGIELITRYHIPFIVLEFTPSYLKLHGTDPREFLELFQKNGYHLSTKDFFDKNIFSFDSVLKDGIFNLYITYSKFIE